MLKHPRVEFFLQFIVLIFCFFENCNVAMSDELEKPNVNSMDFSNSNYGNLATSPSCLLDATGLATIIGTFVGGVSQIVGGALSVNAGNTLLTLPDITGWTKVKAAILIGSGWINVGIGTAELGYLAMAGAGFGKCMQSFVKDPKEYYPKVLPANHPDFDKVGKMKMVVTNNKGNFVGFSTVEGTKFKYGNKEYECRGKPGEIYDEEQCGFLAMKAKASDKLTVCTRDGDPVGLFDIKGCYSAWNDGKAKRLSTAEGPVSLSGIFGGDIGTFGISSFEKFLFDLIGFASVLQGKPINLNRDIVSPRSYAEGPGAIMCPEEFRQVGRMAEVNPDSTGYRKLKCKETRPDKCPKGTMSEKFRGSGDLERFKLYFGDPHCATGEAGSKVSLDGYNYKIVQRGTKLCARLTGLAGGIPWVQSYIIGCIEKLNTNLTPKCASSMPIFENFTFDPDTGIITGNGTPCADGSTGAACTSEKSHNRIIKYDDSACYNKCAVSQMCTVVTKGLFHAPIPITSFLMACIKDSVGNLLYGCESMSLSINSQQNNVTNNGGMLNVVQKRMRPIIMIMLLLSVILFGMQVLLFDSMPKIPDIMAFMLKIALVLYLTNASGRENGMETYGNYIDKISSTLQSMVLNTKSSGICDYSDKSYKLKVPIAGGGRVEKDFSYLKVWDLLDCRFFYYFNPLGAIKSAGASSVEFLKTQSVFDVLIGIFNLATFQIIFVIIAVVLFGIFLLFTIIQIVELMVLSILAFHVLILISPIFIPFILFKATKQTFDGWINQLITYSLYPVMLFSFLSFMFIIVDYSFFGSTKFKKEEAYVSGYKVRVFNVDNTISSGNCNGFQTYNNPQDIEPGKIPVGCDCNAVGCMMNSIAVKTRPSTSFLGPSVGASVEASSESTHKLEVHTLGLMFIMFVLYHLSKMMMQIAQALSGTTKALMNAGRTTKSAYSRMEGLGVMTAGLFNSNKRNNNKDSKSDSGDGGSDDGGDDKKAPRTSGASK